MLPAEPAFHAATGQKVALAALPRLRWLANDRPSVSDRVTRLLTIDAWLAGRLDGSVLVRRSRTPRRRVCWTWQVGSGPPSMMPRGASRVTSGSPRGWRPSPRAVR